jgi:hypothetical protein
MKKILTASLVALALVTTSVSANAAGTTTIKKPSGAAAEGTAAHESSETGETQKKEATAPKKATSKKTATKKPVAKKSKNATK